MSSIDIYSSDLCTFDSVPLLVIIVSFIVDNIEEPKLVDTFARADDPQPIPQLLLLEKFLGPAIASD